MWKDAWSVGGAVFPSADNPPINTYMQLKGLETGLFFIPPKRVDLQF